MIAQTLAQYPYADLSRYPGGTEPGISRNAYGLLGSGSVLLELRGGIGTQVGRLHPEDRLPRVAGDRRGAGEAIRRWPPSIPTLADILVVPADGVPPSPGPGEGDDDHHLGN